MDLKKLFCPDSLAVVGASNKEGKLGYNVLNNLINHGFRGDLYPVNPGADKVQGIKAYGIVGDIGPSVDAAVLIVPAKITPEVVRECFENGIKFVTIEAAGFGEAGEKGKKIKEDLEILLDEYEDCHVLGPNCTGIINVNNGMCQSIGRVGELKPGSVGLIAQAGVYAAGILWGLRRIMDFSIIATVGNKMDIDETDILEYMGQEETIDVIAMYLEDIKRGREFLKTARAVVQEKPVVVLKGARTKEGKAAAVTHTAAIGGPTQIYDTIFEESGIIQAEDNDHLFDIARAFSKQNLPESGRFMIASYSGSQGITATDTLNEEGLGLAELSEDTKDKMDELLPGVIEGYNPADFTFDQSPEKIRNMIEIVSSEDTVGGFLIVLQPERLGEYVDIFGEVDSGGKPILLASTGREFVMDEVIEMEKRGHPLYSTPERAAQVLSEMWRYRNNEVTTPEPERDTTVDGSRVQQIISEVEERGEKLLGLVKTFEVFKAYDIPVSDCYSATSPDEAVEMSKKLDGPVAMKIESPQVSHKSDVGGIRLDVSEEEVESSYRQLIDEVLSRSQGLEEDSIDGVCLQPMFNEGKEVLIGAVYEEILDGHLIKFGLGGKYTEVFGDVSNGISPLDREKASKMIDDTRYIDELLKGQRGEEPYDLQAVVDVLVKLSQLVEDFPEIGEVEANPFLVFGSGGVVLDARLKLK